eukprot:808794-Rhodomonas_salina.2
MACEIGGWGSAAGDVRIQVLENGAQVAASVPQIRAHIFAEALAVTPNHTRAGNPTVALLAAAGLDPSREEASYACVLGGNASVSELVSAPSTSVLNCTLPAWELGAGLSTVEVRDALRHVTLPGPLPFVFDPHIDSVDPTMGLASEGTVVTIVGGGR